MKLQLFCNISKRNHQQQPSPRVFIHKENIIRWCSTSMRFFQTPNFGRMNRPRHFAVMTDLVLGFACQKYSPKWWWFSGDLPMVKRKKITLNKPQGMVYVSSLDNFLAMAMFYSFQVCMGPHQSQLLQLPPELEKMTNLVFWSFLNIPMEVQKVHMIAHYNKSGWSSQ